MTTLQAILDAAHLTDRERLILTADAALSFRDLGADLGVSRQRVQQIEADALRKLQRVTGRRPRTRIERATLEAAERVEVLRERGRRVRLCELRHDDDTPARRWQPVPEDEQHERRVAEFLARVGG